MLLAVAAQAGDIQLGFSKSFTPSTIGPGSTSTLVFSINNNTPGPIGNIAFVDNLPAGVVIADFAAAVSNCAGTVSAPNGGSTITFSDGVVAGFSSCTITADVTSSTPGTHTNVSGDLTSDAGNSGPAVADLIVATDRPGFSKSFSPSPVSFGARSTLTFTIDNSANPAGRFSLTFTDNLPVGMVVADPANAASSCIGGVANVTAVPGTGLVALGPVVFNGDPSVAAMSVCTVAVDVLASGVGTLGNTSSNLTSTNSGGTGLLSSGMASAALEVERSTIHLIKSFTDDPVPPAATATLEFTITNFDRDNPATGITFTDDLDAVLSGLVAVGLPLADPCGAGSLLSGTSLLTLTGGTLPAEGSCTFALTLQLPMGGSAGVFPNTTSAVTGDVGGSPVVGNTAADLLFVVPGPLLTKEFTDDPVGGGGVVNLEFTVTNTSATSAATDIAFSDELDAVLVGATVPANGFCGAGATMFYLPSTDFEPGRLFVSGADLAPSASCTFSVDLDVIAGAPAGFYPNVTSPITATVDAAMVTWPGASDDLEILGGPTLFKEFTDDPADPGGTVTLEFTIEHDAFAPADATGITFTDDLEAALSGLVAMGLPMNDVCGTGSQLSGTSTLAFTGGTLAPGETCVFSATLQVPADAPSGPHTNTTSVVAATVSGVAVMGNAATGDLMVSGLDFSKEFLDDPTIPGDTVTLRFTIDNVSPVSDATSITFSDDLDAVLSGLVAAGLPANDICGTGSAISGTSVLSFVGGNLVAGASCTFDLTLQVPAGAEDGIYGNATSQLQATMEGGPLSFAPATDDLEVSSELLSLGKEFTDDPVAPGDTVTLEFTLTNLDSASPATGITFSDDLDAALSGLVAVGLPAMNVCGAGSQISGTGLLSLTGGNLPVAGTCVFSVTLQVPAGAPLGSVATNVTSSVSGTIDGLPVTGLPATADLMIDFFSFSKSFSGPATAGGTVDLTFSITNETAASASVISFSDDLDAVVSGLVAVGLPAADICGAGSSMAGTSFLTLTNGNLLPGASCSIVVTLQVPVGATVGTFVNTTSELVQGGLPAAAPAVDDLTIEPPPTFAKVFAPDTMLAGAVSTLTFTIDNSASALAASGLDFTDNLPAGVVVANPANASTTCSGGALTAVAGTAVVSYTGGSVAAGASCTVQADVTSATAGAHVNTTGDLTSSSGNSGTASDTLTVLPPPVPSFSKVFAPDVIAQDEVSTLTLTIDNGASFLTATGLDFTDNLPAGLVVATPANAATTCAGGILTAVSGSAVVSYSGGSVGAGASCTVQADVTGGLAGVYVNVTGDLTSSAGNSGSATDDLEITDEIAPEVTLVDSILGTGDGELEECESAATVIDALTVTFDEAMFNPGNDTDPNSVTNPNNWLVVASGPDLDISTTACGAPGGDDVAVPLLDVTYAPATLTAGIQFAASLADGPYRLLACSGGLADLVLNPLDGDGDGTGGDDFVRTFRVDRIDAFANGHFDCSLDGWQTVMGLGSSVVHDPAMDLDGAGISGSAHFSSPPSGDELVLGQCVDLAAGAVHGLSGSVFLDTPGTALRVVRTCTFFAGPGCSGAALPAQAFFDLVTTSGSWTALATQPVAVPANADSGLCDAVLSESLDLAYEAFLDDLSLDLVQSPVIFADGFESGDTSAWSVTIP